MQASGEMLLKNLVTYLVCAKDLAEFHNKQL